MINTQPFHLRCSISVSKQSRKKALQVLLRQQKKVAHSISLLDGYNTPPSSYAWKTVKAIEKKISEMNIEIENESIKLYTEHSKQLIDFE